MTQQELADASGVTRQTVSNLERGTVPQAENLARILDALGIDTSGNGYSSDTDMWLGIIGGMLETLPPMRREPGGRDPARINGDLRGNDRRINTRTPPPTQ